MLTALTFGQLHAESEPNDSCGQANLLLDTGSGTDSGWINGTVDDSSDKDWYKIVLTQQAEIRFDRRARNNKKTRIGLYKADCSSSAGWSSNSKNSNKTKTLAAGTYYLRVWRSNADNAQYKVKARLTKLTNFSVTKTVDNPNKSVGELVTYTIEVRNEGPTNSKVHITDTLPSGLTYDSQSGCTHSGNGIECKKWINAGDSKTITLKATVDAGASGTVTNTVNIEKDNTNSTGKKTFETDLTDNEATADITIGAATTDLAITSLSDSPDPAGTGEDITYKVGISNNGNIASNVELNLTVSAGALKTAASGWSCSGTTAVVCQRSSNMADGDTETAVFVFTAPGSAQTVTLDARIGSAEHDSNTGNNSASTTTDIMEVVDNADDLCYEDPVGLGGFMCQITNAMSGGFCTGGMGCGIKFPLRNISNSTLSDVSAILNEDNMGGGMFSDCGVEPSGNCGSTNDLGFGPFGMFGKATEFNLTDPIAPDDNDSAIWVKDMMSMKCLNSNDLYGTYVKDGKLHRGHLQACSDFKPTDPDFTECGLFPSALNTWEDINRGNSDLVIDADTIYADNVNGTGGSSQDIQCEYNSTTQSCSVEEMTVPIPTLPNFISSPVSGSAVAGSTESDPAYGDLTVDSDLHFVPNGTYTNGNPVMLINSLTVNNGATVTFDAGDYWIGSLTATQGVTIKTNGAVRLFVNDSVDLEDNFLDINYDNGNGLPGNLFIFVYGDFTWASMGGGYQQDMAAYVFVQGEYTANHDTANSHFKGAVTAVHDINLNNNQEYTYDPSGLINGWGACPNCVYVEFAQDRYDISEDINYIGTTETVWPVIKLDRASATDITVHYRTVDGTATVADGDYIGVTDETVTIPAGDLNVSIPIHIYNDAPIELDEYFHVELFDPSTGACLGTTDRTKINILAQEDAPTCFEDDFSHGLDSKWRVLRSVGNFVPGIVNVNGDYRLRITPDATNIATVITKDYEFTTSQNLIIVEFDYYAYGGCNHGGLGDDGADGIVNVLFDSSVGDSPVPGGLGGSMGYAQMDVSNNSHDHEGFEGGWLGLGIDEYGNFGNCNEGRVGGLPGTSCDWNSGFNPQDHRNTAVIRGDGSGYNGYEFLQGVELTKPPLSEPKVADKASNDYFSGRYKMTIDARDPNHLYIRLQRSLSGNPADYVTIIDQFDAKDPQYNQGTTPDFVRYAISGGTGGGCNNHELSWIKLRGNCAVYGGGEVYTTGPFGAWDTFRGDLNGDDKMDDMNISTKVVGKPFELIIGSLGPDGRTLELKPNIDARYSLRWLDDSNNDFPYDTNLYTFNASQANAITHTFTVSKAFKKMYTRIQYCADQNSSGGMILKPYGDCNSQTPLWEGLPVSNTTQGVHLRYHISDVFAVRPKKFDINATAGETFVAMKPKAIQFKALTQGGVPAEDYNETEGDTFIVELNLSDASLNCPNPNTDITPMIAFEDGLSTQAQVKIEDVGPFTLQIHEKAGCTTRYAGVDCDDGDINGFWTKAQDLSIEPKAVDILIVPATFDITDSDYVDFGSNFTYLNNLNEALSMYGQLQLEVTALKADGNTAVNYISTCAAKATHYTIAYTPSSIPNLTRIQYHRDTNTTIIESDINGTFEMDLPSSLFSGTPSNGVSELKIDINFNRNRTQVVNPFGHRITDVTVRDADGVTGTKPINKLATYLYGRLHAPRYSVTSASGSLPVYYEFYYDVTPGIEGNSTLSNNYTGAGSSDRSKDAIYWYKNNAHQTGDGTITGIGQYGASDLYLSTNVGVTNGVQIINYSYSGNDYPYRATIKFDTAPWLIYNHYDAAATQMSTSIEINSEDASGTGTGINAGGDTDAEDAPNRPRRIQW